MDRGSPEPGGGVGEGVECQHLGKCVWLRLYVCVSVRAFVYLCVFVTLTPFCPRWPREGTLMEGEKETFALMHFKTDGQEHLQL